MRHFSRKYSYSFEYVYKPYIKKTVLCQLGLIRDIKSLSKKSANCCLYLICIWKMDTKNDKQKKIENSGNDIFIANRFYNKIETFLTWSLCFQFYVQF